MANSSSWYAIYTKSRQEKQVAAYLSRMGVQTFVPLRKCWSIQTDRKLVLEVPALPGYLFVNCTLYAETRAAIKRATGVVTLVESAGRPAEIPHEQIDALRLLLERTFNAQGHPYLKTGQRVRVKRGPLEGLEGFLVRVDANRQRLVIAVDHVNQALSVELDGHYVEAATAS